MTPPAGAAIVSPPAVVQAPAAVVRTANAAGVRVAIDAASDSADAMVGTAVDVPVKIGTDPSAAAGDLATAAVTVLLTARGLKY